MARSTRSITFTVEKGIKRPKSITESNIVYALYAPERIKLNAGDFKYIVMGFSLTLPENIIGTFLIISSLKMGRLKLTNYSFPQHGGKVRFELFNQNHNKKIGIEKKRQTCNVHDNK